jgi:ABC-type branched-subunit amino acid transport system permease subunit
MTSTFTFRTILTAAFLAAIAAIGLGSPGWALFPLSLAMANSLVILGLVGLIRTGGVSFGQALYFGGGAYVAGQTSRLLHSTDAFVAIGLGGATGIVVAAILGPFLTRFRGIFFAMLTLAISMVAHGLLLNAGWLGGSDGMSVPTPTYLGFAPTGPWVIRSQFVLCGLLALATAGGMAAFFRSSLGLATLAVGQNEIRVEYLGGSTRRIMWTVFVIAGGLSGMGGAAAALILGHVDPEWMFWTKSGEFVLTAILSGSTSIVAVFVATLFMEALHTFAADLFPSMWQLALGTILLFTIFVAPDGLGSVTLSRWLPKRGATTSI